MAAKVGGVTVQVDGARQLRATMRKAGADMGDFRDANREAASTVAAAAPPWIHQRSGALAASIRPGGGATSAVVRAGGAKVPYAGVIEWGWPGHHIAPRPYLTTAAKQTEPSWVQAYWARLDAIVGKIKGK